MAEQDEVLVLGARVLTGFDASGAARWYEDAGVLVRDGRIAEVSDAAGLRRRHPGLDPVGGAGCAVVPGFVNAHHHVGLTPFQLGSADHPLELWFASRLALRDVDLGLDTLYSGMEMIASGVTAVQHLHSRASGGADDVLGAADRVLGAYRALGMRVSYSMALRDQNRIVYGDDAAFAASVPAPLQEPLRRYLERFTLPLAEQVEVFRALRERHHERPLTAVQLAPANLHWLSDDALATAAGLAEDTGAPLHMHVVETPYQREYALRRTGGTAVEHLARFGLLTPALTIGHGVWMSESDIEACAGHGVRVCHNCSSNLRLASGRAPVTRMIAAGIEVAIGIDEAGINDDRDMLQELRLVLLANREPGIDAPRLDADTVLRMATEHGAATTGFADAIGRIEVGREADLVVLDWDRITHPFQDPAASPAEVVVQRAKAGAVRDVMIGGSWVLRDRRFTTVDRDAVLAEIAERLGRPRSEEEEARRGFASAVEVEVRRFYDGYLGPDGLDAR